MQGVGGEAKNHRGMCFFFDKVMILQEVKATIQPLGVGYTNRQKGGG